MSSIPPPTPTGSYPQQPYPYPPRPMKDRSIALILEIVLGLMGILGIGWIYSGQTTTGILWLVGALVWNFIGIGIIALTAGAGCCFTLPVSIGMIVISVVSLNSHTKRRPEMFL